LSGNYVDGGAQRVRNLHPESGMFTASAAHKGHAHWNRSIQPRPETVVVLDSARGSTSQFKQLRDDPHGGRL